jgi:hypothetical protein
MVALLAACGGSGSSKSGSSAGSGGKDDTFTQLYNKRKDARIRVTYETHGNDGKVEDTFTISQDGPDRVAYIAKDSKTVVNGQSVTTCANIDTQPDCNEVPGGPDATKAVIAGLTGAFTLADTAITAAASAGKFGDKSTETIAGRDAQCVKLTVGSALGNIGGAIAKAVGGNTKAGYQTCIDKETGVLLQWQVVGVGNDQSALIATKVDQPEDSDFTTPTTTSTSEATSGSTDTTQPESSTTIAGSDTTGGSGTTGGGGTTGTTACTPYTLPNGATVPNVPCLPSISS